MARRFRKRSQRERGHRTHGYGAGKKHRGKGNKGGRGFAWDKHLWVYTLKYEPDHFGKFGFQSPGQKIREASINVGLLDATYESLLRENLAEKRGDSVFIDCARLGIGKVLGSGKVSHKLIVSCPSFSKGAKEKLSAAGGQALPPGEGARKPD